SDHEREIMAGTSEQPRHVYITHSDDDGLTWSEPKNISATTRKDHWRWYATGPGNAIQLQHGEHAGRIVVPCNHSDHSDPDKHPYRSHVIYLDPDAHDWQIGAVHEDKTNESAIAEMHDGTLLQAMRSYHGKNRRALAWSSDAGASFSPVTLQGELDTPVCQASLIALPGHRVAFASPKGKNRANMTVWISADSGVTWPVEKTIYPDGAAYSNLVLLPGNNLGLLYEKDGNQTISFTTFPIPSK
ncbi:MAG: sialidase family protein, partial [Verrucomicrobiales bacterium]|nr:sialidase family protein [Verrucomicrobiales bacterium]